MGLKRVWNNLSGKVFMLVESVRMSVSNIRQNRMRSFLTILGIMIGVTAVIALVTTVSGVSSSISDSFSSMGASTMTLSATGTDLQAGLSVENLEEISSLEHIEGVSPSVSLSATVALGATIESGRFGARPFHQRAGFGFFQSRVPHQPGACRYVFLWRRPHR